MVDFVDSLTFDSNWVADVFLWRLVRPRQDGERAWPLAKMLLGAKHEGRPPIVSRIIVHDYCAL